MSPERVSTSSRLRRGAAGLEFRSPRPPRRSSSRRLRSRRILRLMILLLIIVLAGEIVYSLYHSPRFDLATVEIRGASPQGQLLVRGQLPPLGVNLLAIDRAGLKKNLRDPKKLSFVQAVAIKRRLPGTLQVLVQPRHPIAFLRQAWGEARLDDSGVLFVSPDPRPDHLPELQGLTLPASALGRPLSGERAVALQEGLAALAKSPKLQIKSLAIDERGWLTAQLVDGPELRLGPAKNLAEKVRRATIALSQHQGETAAVYLDFSAPEAPVWKPKSE